MFCSKLHFPRNFAQLNSSINLFYHFYVSQMWFWNSYVYGFLYKNCQVFVCGREAELFIPNNAWKWSNYLRVAKCDICFEFKSYGKSSSQSLYQEINILHSIRLYVRSRMCDRATVAGGTVRALFCSLAHCQISSTLNIEFFSIKQTNINNA